MDTREIVERVAQQKKSVAGVLRGYVASNCCPCHWPQFEYWVGKSQGPGWQDEIQNDLIKAAIELKCFDKTSPSAPEYGLEDELRCSVCGTKWKHFSEEWRMLAFRERLVRFDGLSPDAAAFSGLIGANVFATVGQEPSDSTRSLTLDQWASFMEGKPYEARPFGSLAGAESSRPPSLLRRIINALTRYP